MPEGVTMESKNEHHIPKNLMDEIATRENVEASFDYIVAHLEGEQQRNTQKKRKRKVCDEVLKELSNGSFKIKEFTEMEVKDGPKARVVQAPRVPGRVGCHAVMVVLEKYLYPMLIKNTAASIKGRGMHWLHHILEEDIKELSRRHELFYYQCDIRHFYDSIDQDKMMSLLCSYFEEEALLKILNGFVRLMPRGISKGLRSSQCMANMLLSDTDHDMMELVMHYTMAETGENRALYYRYCDDIVMLDTDKRRLWKLRNVLVEKLTRLGLEIKPNEAVRPLSEGLDYLGYVHYETHSLLRKRTKQKAARALKRVKSRKRRQQIIGSFNGMACHADCKHLFYKLTGKKMKKFSEMGIVYVPKDGKKRFPGAVTRLAALQNKEIEIHDFERDVKTSQGEGRFLVSFRDVKDGQFGKFFTNGDEMKDALEQMSERDAIPFETVIVSETFDKGKVRYRFT